MLLVLSFHIKYQFNKKYFSFAFSSLTTLSHLLPSSTHSSVNPFLLPLLFTLSHPLVFQKKSGNSFGESISTYFGSIQNNYPSFVNFFESLLIWYHNFDYCTVLEHNNISDVICDLTNWYIPIMFCTRAIFLEVVKYTHIYIQTILFFREYSTEHCIHWVKYCKS